MLTLQMLATASAPAVLFLSLPFLATALAGLLAIAAQRALRSGPTFARPAGPWLVEQARRLGLDVRVQVSPELVGSADGFWPRSSLVGLSPSTWTDTTLAGRTIAAHELGHALTWTHDPSWGALLGHARRVQQGATTLAASGFLVGALLDSPFAIVVGVSGLVGVILGGVGVLYDEATASIQGARLLQREGLRTRGTDLSMLLAFTAYASPLVVLTGFLVQLPLFVDALLAPSPRAVANSAPGLWAVLLLSPVLVLRAAQVLSDLPSPAPLDSEFRLSWSLFRERSWELHSGTIVLLWLLLSWNEPLADGLAPLFVIGALPAVTTLGAWGRMIVVLPVYLVLALGGAFEHAPTTRSPRHPAPAGPEVLFDPDPPLWFRAASLVRIAWLPLVPILFARAVQGW